jgi:hypothetical protein
MAVRDSLAANGEKLEAILGRDERWLLVQRIVDSKSFERASQLRKILVYVTRSAILEPDRVLREYDIACEGLERRKDFDPASDNIVRSQFSHLRRKLEAYFDEEGKGETLIVKIPKGGYAPVFVAASFGLPPAPAISRAVPSEPPQEEARVENPAAPADVRSQDPERPARNWSKREWAIAALCLAPSVVLTLILLFSHDSVKGRGNFENSVANDNAFVRFLGHWEGETTVVAPDASLVLTELGLNIEDIPLSEYTGGQYPVRQIAAESDPKLRQTIAYISDLRATTFNEAMIAADFVAALDRIGLHAKPRYGRDLHVSDLNDGNTILIGGQGSDPWVSLFTDKMNFRFVEERGADRYYFLNAKPAAGEQGTYTVHYSHQGSDAVGYADIALIPNPSHSGFILIISASDQTEAVSAAHMLLRGKLPSEVTALLERKDLRYFELFFRGKHIAGQADSSLELVAYRPL